MLSLKTLSLKFRLIISIGVVTALVLTTVTVIVGLKTRSVSRIQATSATKNLVDASAEKVKVQVGRALESARVVSRAMSGIRAEDSGFSRASAVEMLKEILRGNNQLLGVWTCWEPDAFDGADGQASEAFWNSEKGRFVPYAYRDGGQIAVMALNDYQQSDYYTKAKNAGREAVLEPFQYEIEGKQVLMTTLAVPIKINGRILGVAGVDLSLDAFNQMVSQMDLIGGGNLTVISQGNKFIGHPDAAMAGSRVSEAHSWFGQFVSKISSGQSFTTVNRSDQFEGQALRVAVPFEIGSSGSKWTAMATLPMGAILAQANEILRLIIIIGGIGFISVMALLYLLSNSIANPILRIVQGLNGSSKQVASASSQLSSTSQSLAEGSSEQASSLEETSSSIEQMASQTRQNSNNADQADSAVKETAKVVENGVSSMEKMNAAINEIKESSNETSKIIKTIDDIAFQTNLLALNAAVEAARAGEAGKGFAVVAEEVRNLAQRSAEAAQNTSQLIEKSQENANNGVSVAEEVSAQLSSIKESSTKVTTLISEITAASKEQAQGLDQVNTAVSEMDKVVQRNAADSEESASAAEELSAQATEMEKMVAELEAVVSGSGTNGYTPNDNSEQVRGRDQAHQTAQTMSRSADRNQKPSLQKSKPADKQRSSGTMGGHVRANAAEQVISLDDQDFKDF